MIKRWTDSCLWGFAALVASVACAAAQAAALGSPETKFYTPDVVSIGEGEGIYIGRDAGWDWADSATAH